LVEFLLSALWEIVLQLGGELLLEVAFRSIGEPWRSRTEAHPLLAGLGTLICGAAAGLLTSLVWPARMIRYPPIPGLSLFVSPLISGLMMERYGQWLEKRGGSPSFVATFWGGALFAFGMALVRFLWLRTSIPL
jgi:hypothetical protein